MSSAKKPPQDQRFLVLESVLKRVPSEGWTPKAYVEGVKRSGVGAGVAGLLFPQGHIDVIAFFGQWVDTQMQARIRQEPGFAVRRVRYKITFGVRARLEALTPHREAFRRLMVWYALPHHAPLGLRRLYRTVDLIWRAAGGASTDFNFYTKRALLAGVLKATLLIWLDDVTPGCTATWSFLDRRITDVLRAGKSLSLMREWSPRELLEMARRRMGWV